MAGPYRTDMPWSYPPRGVRQSSWEASDAICREAIKRTGTDTCTVAFSTGKDSLAMLIALKAHFKTIIPVYWYLVPGLGFVERALQYYEQVFGFEVMRLPHPVRWHRIREWAWQPPDRYDALDYIAEFAQPYTMDELWGEVRKAGGLDKLGGKNGCLHGTGIRASDSPIRASLYRKHGGFAPNGLVFYPVITWNLDDIEAGLDHTGLKLPEEYNWLGRSFDGLFLRYIEPIKREFPEDYAKIVADFPLIELEFYRAKMSKERQKKPLHREVGREHEAPDDAADGIDEDGAESAESEGAD